LVEVVYTQRTAVVWPKSERRTRSPRPSDNYSRSRTVRSRPRSAGCKSYTPRCAKRYNNGVTCSGKAPSGSLEALQQSLNRANNVMSKAYAERIHDSIVAEV
jgi:hypothetical protein